MYFCFFFFFFFFFLGLLDYSLDVKGATSTVGKYSTMPERLRLRECGFPCLGQRSRYGYRFVCVPILVQITKEDGTTFPDVILVSFLRNQILLHFLKQDFGKDDPKDIFWDIPQNCAPLMRSAIIDKGEEYNEREVLLPTVSQMISFFKSDSEHSSEIPSDFTFSDFLQTERFTSTLKNMLASYGASYAVIFFFFFFFFFFLFDLCYY